MKIRILILILFCSIFATAQNSAFDLAKNHFIKNNETLKVKAVEFLENNIDEHFTYTYYYVDSIGNKIDFSEFDFPSYNESRKALKALNLKPIAYKIPDNRQISENQIIEIVERGFEAWSKPWNKNLSFDDFCDYLLPYRVQNEPIEDWHSVFKENFSFLKKNRTSEIVNSVNSYLKTSFFSSFSFTDITESAFCQSPSQMLFRKQGNCQDLCNLSVYVMRMLGLPVSIDFTPAWATSSYNHFWCSYINENGEHRPFEGVTGMANDFVIFREPSKVFRMTYRTQPNMLADKIPADEIPTNFLRARNIIDVTSDYWRTSNLQCKITKTPKNSISYISVFNGLRWVPVDWAEVKDSKAYFKDLSVGVVYMPVNFENKKIQPSGNPVLIYPDKNTKELIPNYKDKITVKVTEAPKYLIYKTGKKYTFFYWDKKWINAGTQTANEDKVLSFENVPSNTLYLLISEYSQKKERVFTVKADGTLERW